MILEVPSSAHCRTGDWVPRCLGSLSSQLNGDMVESPLLVGFEKRLEGKELFGVPYGPPYGLEDVIMTPKAINKKRSALMPEEWRD